jgi:hypothetical protein
VAEVGVGVTERPVSFSGDFASIAKSLLVYGVVGRFFSGDLSEGLEGDAGIDPPSRKLLRSLTLPVCIDCMRLWAAPLMSERSGDSLRRGEGFDKKASRAFSVKAA